MNTIIDSNGALVYRFTDGTCYYADGFERESEHITLQSFAIDGELRVRAYVHSATHTEFTGV